MALKCYGRRTGFPLKLRRRMLGQQRVNRVDGALTRSSHRGSGRERIFRSYPLHKRRRNTHKKL